jgi:hypothetical protein
MADTTDSTESGGGKTTLDKIIDIVHTMVHSSSGGEEKKDPVADSIKKMSNESQIGGGYRKAKMDKAISDSGG